MKHRDQIIDHVIEVISGDASLIIDVLGKDAISEVVKEFDDDDLRYYFESGYAEYYCVEDLIDQIDAEHGDEQQ